MAPPERIIPVSLAEEMKTAYIDYSMSVIVSRALPDVRDGLKPVHRRVLYGMHELGLSYNKPHKKSARIVGEVLGKYHPHGDSSVYDSMVRMAQPWSLRYPLVDGQGNFGSIDGDSPAAMRYTEARLSRIAGEMLADIDKDTVDFAPNFDDSLKEPVVLPTRLPNLLVNGTSGIAVGMATNMLPHNLTEVVNGLVAMVDHPEITVDELMKHISGPDFPTGGIIYGYRGVKDAYETGRGRIIVRGRATIESSSSGRETIVITEIPYQVNKASLVMKIADLVNAKKIEGISDIRDESDRNGMRIVIEVKRDAMAKVVLSKLYKYTPLQSSFGVNNVALVAGRPMLLSLKDLMREFIQFRLEVIIRRTRYELNKALEKAHILVGLLIALDYLDAVIALIRASKTPDEARQALMRGDFIKDKKAFYEKFADLLNTRTDDQHPEEGHALTEAQAKAILDMRLQKLTGLEREKIRAEFDELQKAIARYREILRDETIQRAIVKEELEEVKEKYGDERRTEIDLMGGGDIDMTDLIPDEEVVVTISHLGYIKRTPVSEYRRQGRGGRGARGAKTRDEDFIVHMFVANTHAYLLFFTAQGKCHWLRVYEIPEATKTSSGRVVQNIMSIPKDDKIKAYIKVQDLKDEDFLKNHYVMFATRRGRVKKTSMEAFSRPRNGGINALTINEGDELLEVRLTNGRSQIFLGTRMGNAIRFEEANVRPMGRTAAGVSGINLVSDEDAVVGMSCIDPADKDHSILVISENGYGKRSAFEDYRLINRGGKGVRTMMVTEKTGYVIALKAAKDKDDLMITTRGGIVIRMPVADIRVMGRATQGVRVIRIPQGDQIADVALVSKNSLEEEY